MPGEHAEDVGLSAVEEINRLHARSYGNDFRVKQKKWFTKIWMLNEVFGFLNPPRVCLRSKKYRRRYEQNLRTYTVYADYDNFF